MPDDLEPFATSAMLAAFWRPLTPAEITRADGLLLYASNKLRLMAREAGFDLDEKVAADGIYKSNVQYVVMESVKRALQTSQDTPPVESYSQTAGPYSENYKLSNPSGDMWFKKTELLALGLSGAQRLYSISTTREEEEIYS